MPGKIFINYRRGDDPGFTQALYQRLEEEFPSGDLFMDVEGQIKPGDDFVAVLSAQVAQCDVMLAVIGPRWVVLMDARAGSADDFVTIEIRAALEQDKRVIPVLVGGAGMPASEAVPEPIRALARRNAVGLRPERFKADCQGLMSALKEQLAAAEQERAARTEAERAAAEAERLKREAEEAARIAAEERARAQAIAGLSQEEIRKAEELANWDFIKERSDAQLLRDHLARFPGGVTVLYARTRLEEMVWAGLGESPDMASLEAFVEEFPNGTNAEAARSRLADLQKQAAEARALEERRAQETAEWGEVAAGTDAAALEAFLEKWPASAHKAAARSRLQEVEWGAVARGTDPKAIKAFLGRWPKGQNAAAARARLQHARETAEWVVVAASTDPKAIEAFLEKWPQGQHAPAARALLHEAEWRALAASSDAEAIEAFLDRWPQGQHAAAARARLQDVEWGALRASTNLRAIREFLGKWPQGQHAAAARTRLRRLKGARLTRRALIAAAGGGAFVTLVPGQRVWRHLNDRSESSAWAHSGGVASVAITKNGQRVVSSGFDGMIKVWELASDRLHPLSELRLSRRVAPAPIAIVPRDGHVVFGDGPEIKVWEPGSSNPRLLVPAGPLPPPRADGTTFVHQIWWCIAVTSDNRRVVSGADFGAIRVSWLANGSEVFGADHPSALESSSVTSVTITPNGRQVISGSTARRRDGENTVKVWDLASGRPVRTLGQHSAGVTSVAVAPDGRVISGSRDGTVKIWELTGSRAPTTLGRPHVINSVAVTPNGQRVIAAIGDAEIAVWDLAPGPNYSRTLIGHLNWGFDWANLEPGFNMGVNCVAVTPNGERVISGGGDGTIKVWAIG